MFDDEWIWDLRRRILREMFYRLEREIFGDQAAIDAEIESLVRRTFDKDGENAKPKADGTETAS